MQNLILITAIGVAAAQLPRGDSAVYQDISCLAYKYPKTYGITITESAIFIYDNPQLTETLELLTSNGAVMYKSFAPDEDGRLTIYTHDLIRGSYYARVHYYGSGMSGVEVVRLLILR